MVNSNKLLGVLKEKQVTQESLCKQIRMNKKTFYNRLQRKRFFSDEIEKIAQVLNLSCKEIIEIFFTNLVTSCVTEMRDKDAS